MTAPTDTQAAVVGQDRALYRYMDVIVGQRSWPRLIYFELCTFLSAVPGAAGLTLRGIFWPRLFRSCGKGTVFGANVLLRHPGRIEIGERVVISDGCILDARHEEVERAIVLGDNVMLANFVMLSCKGGTIAIDGGVGLGAQTIVQAVNDCHVAVGKGTMVGPRCYIAGGGNYDTDYSDRPMLSQGLRKNEVGVTIGEDVWLGANVTVLPGVAIGRGSVVGAGAVVTKFVGEREICAGVPARVIRVRGDG